jgi:hypothetical protein
VDSAEVPTTHRQQWNGNQNLQRDELAVQLSRLEFPMVVNLQHFPDLSAICSDGVFSIFVRVLPEMGYAARF